MRQVARWLTTVLFYLANIGLIFYCFRNKTLWRVYLEPLVLLECFIALGLIASDFLTPSLSRISRKILHVSDRVSGLTLLALGNAVPDITSTYQAMSADATTMAVGELFGGIFFLLTVVLGSMALVKPIELRPLKMIAVEESRELESFKAEEDERRIIYDRSDFIQDIAIFAGLVMMSAIFLSDGRLMFWECVVMVISYGAYATYLVFYQKSCVADICEVEERAVTDEPLSDLSTMMTNTDRASLCDGNIRFFDSGVHERRANIRRRIRRYLRSNYNGWVRITLRDCLDIWENEDILQMSRIGEQEDDVDSVYENNQEEDRLVPIRRTTSLQDVRQIPSIYIPEEQSRPGSVSSSVDEPTENSRLLSTKVRPFSQKSLSCDHIPGFFSSCQRDQGPADSICSSGIQLPEEDTMRSWPSDFKLISYLTDKSMCLPTTEYIALFFTTPVSLLLCLLIPFLHHREEDRDIHIVEAIRLTLLPIMTWCLVHEPSFSLPPYLLFGLSFVILCVLIYRQRRSIVRHNTNIVAVAAFVLCLSTICYCVHIVVMTLTNWAESFNISGTILGLTVFAWGNSMGDLVSNIIFVQIGVLDLALGACFGSPLLYFVFGVGIDGLILIFRRRKNCGGPLYLCHIDYTMDSYLGCSGIGIVLAFLVFAILVPLNNWRIDGKISSVLLTLYAAVIGLSIYREVV